MFFVFIPTIVLNDKRIVTNNNESYQNVVKAHNALLLVYELIILLLKKLKSDLFGCLKISLTYIFSC